VEFLGLLPLYQLAFFGRGIFPLVGRIKGSRQFRLNDEVERVVPIPFSALLEPENYGTYLLDGDWTGTQASQQEPNSFPCFVHDTAEEREVLWGATYRVVMSFLERIFGFSPPPMKARPAVTGTLDSTYRTGRPRGG
jgi:hypothetical protein